MQYHRSEGLKNNPNGSIMTYLPLFNVTKTLCKHKATTTLIINLHEILKGGFYCISGAYEV